MIIFSDESGNDGIPKTKYYHKGQGSSFFKVITMIHFPSELAAKTFLNIANEASYKHFSHSLRKWTKLKGSHKNDDSIHNFFQEVASPISPLIAFCVINKNFCKSPFEVSGFTIEAYRRLFIRSVKFRRWYCHNIEKYKHGAPYVKWFIDFHDDEKFTKPLSKKITDYIQSNNVHFDYPAFIHKKDTTEPNRSYKKLITFTDLIGGVVLRHYHEKSFSKTYSLIEKHSKGVILKAEKDKWHWDNVMCLPSKEAYEDIKHIMGPPSYMKSNW